ncbi:hypothetical protein IMSHALPRED_008180 [Imshaugia aleurites]|uniref:SigF-like NTF2-like domain-containing protein n=1 Tax=Imshaugia aleurites TaxID=172621 RepID=A0A8H3IX22_9LECA|nr:hypothetical protein IMSHALPRED_008180 [Imshaugia aleurites]
MEDPQAEIPQIIHLLTQSPPSTQRKTLEKYFLPSASFTHPFCRTGSFEGSRWLIWRIYRWYKIMSPKIEISVDSVARKSTNATAKKKPPANLIHGNVPAYDPQNLTLYVSIHQLFRLWLLPYLSARVSLVTVLHLTPQTHNNTSPTPTTYLIRAQNDLYQVNEWVKFVSPFGILSVLVYAGQMLATLLCVLGAAVGWPVSWVEQNVIGGNEERGLLDVVKG